MMIPENALNAEDVRGMMLDRMEKHLSLKTEGYRSTTNETFNLLLKAVGEGSSLEAVCADSWGVVDSNTLPGQVTVRLRLYNGGGAPLLIKPDDVWLALGYAENPPGPSVPAEGMLPFELLPGQAAGQVQKFL